MFPVLGFEAILKYANNLYNQPWRSEYKKIRTYSGYFQHEVQRNLIHAENLFLAMGYNEASNDIFIMENDVCPDQIKCVIYDCLAAICEYKIMKSILKILISQFKIDISLDVILNLRKKNIGSAKMFVSLLTEPAPEQKGFHTYVNHNHSNNKISDTRSDNIHRAQQSNEMYMRNNVNHHQMIQKYDYPPNNYMTHNTMSHPQMINSCYTIENHNPMPCAIPAPFTQPMYYGPPMHSSNPFVTNYPTRSNQSYLQPSVLHNQSYQPTSIHTTDMEKHFQSKIIPTDYKTGIASLGLNKYDHHMQYDHKKSINSNNIQNTSKYQEFAKDSSDSSSRNQDFDSYDEVMYCKNTDGVGSADQWNETYRSSGMMKPDRKQEKGIKLKYGLDTPEQFNK